MTDQRKSDLAKIHIARKDMRLDDDTYRAVIAQVGQAASGSSKDLTATGRARVLAHFRSKGWKPKPRARRRTAGAKAPGMATDRQIRMIRGLWIKLADAGVVKARDEAGLRAWVKAATRRQHQSGSGYHAVEFLPVDVAREVIEQLKSWAHRCGVSTDPQDGPGAVLVERASGTEVGLDE